MHHHPHCVGPTDALAPPVSLRGIFVRSLRLACLGLALGVAWPQPLGARNHNDGRPRTVVNAVIDMTCFPPPAAEGEAPDIGPLPPCVLPQGLDPALVSPNPSGRARVIVKDDDTATVAIDLEGLAPGLVVTAWLAYYFPPGPVPHPIFAPTAPGQPPLAGVAVPLAPTTAAFAEGLGIREPNQFKTFRDRGRLLVHLDFNPLKGGQGPLRNEISPVTQTGAAFDSGATQPLCCPVGFPVPRPQPIGASYLRTYDLASGLQMRDPENGRPLLLRSPVPVVVIALVVHIDGTTHGISAGIPIPPRPDVSVAAGDHYTLGLFDLRNWHLE